MSFCIKLLVLSTTFVQQSSTSAMNLPKPSSHVHLSSSSEALLRCSMMEVFLRCQATTLAQRLIGQWDQELVPSIPPGICSLKPCVHLALILGYLASSKLLAWCNCVYQTPYVYTRHPNLSYLVYIQSEALSIPKYVKLTPLIYPVLIDQPSFLLPPNFDLPYVHQTPTRVILCTAISQLWETSFTPKFQLIGLPPTPLYLLYVFQISRCEWSHVHLSTQL